MNRGAWWGCKESNTTEQLALSLSSKGFFSREQQTQPQTQDVVSQVDQAGQESFRAEVRQKAFHDEYDTSNNP